MTKNKIQQNNDQQTQKIRKQSCKSFSIHPASRFLLPVLLVIISALAYANSFKAPFIFDDEENILENPYIRHLWPITRAMSASPQTGVAGRPILSLSLALNYAISGYSVWSYHTVNLALHILAALTLYAIVRRTLLTQSLVNNFGNHAAPLAWAIAAIWAVHPIQTQSVTYIIQRAESLMGLFYLLTLYTAIRAMQSHRPTLWSMLSVLCCALGMLTKEVIVTAPLLVLLYDRTFIAGSFNLALRQRRSLYTPLAATWLIIIVLMWQGPRSGSAGFGLPVLTAWDYALSQFGIIVHYLRLCVWPTPLCLDYIWPVATNWTEILPPMLLIVGLIIVTAYGLMRNRLWACPAASFFLILSPTSSFVPITDLAFEHRMYLPLAPVVVLTVTAAYIALQHLEKYLRKDKTTPLHPLKIGFTPLIGSVSLLLVVAILTLATFRRNEDYRSAASIWKTVLDIAPNNHRAHNNLGLALRSQGKIDEAISHFRLALQFKPDYAEAHVNWGIALQEQGKYTDAISHFRQALQLIPNYAQVYNNIGVVLAEQGKVDEAISQYNRTIELKPDFAEAHNNLGAALAEQGRLDQAVSHYHKALHLKPDFAEAYNNLGFALKTQGKLNEAISLFEQALQLKPGFVEAHNNLAVALIAQGRIDEAVEHFNKALQLKPDKSDFLNNLAWVFAVYKDTRFYNPKEAIRLAQKACELSNYQNPAFLDTLATAYAAAGRFPEAVAAAQKASKLALSLQQTQLAEDIQNRLQLFKTGQPYIESLPIPSN